MKIETNKFSLTFVNPLKTSKGTYSVREGLLINLSYKNQVGIGEASPLRDYSLETLEQVIESFQKNYQKILELTFVGNNRTNYQIFLNYLNNLGLPPSLYFGLETAFLDAVSKDENITISKWLNPSAKDSVPVNILLPSDFEKAKEEIKKHKAEQIFKYKLTQSVEEECAKLKELASVVSAKSQLRLDANQAYSFNDARKLVELCNALPIEYIEEPLKVEEFDSFIELKKISKVPLAFDESLINNISLDQALKQDLADFYILKPSMLGGINATLTAIQKIREFKKEVVITSTLETEVGVIACFHTALAGEVARACGLNTLHLYNSSIQLLEFNDNKVYLKNTIF